MSLIDLDEIKRLKCLDEASSHNNGRVGVNEAPPTQAALWEQALGALVAQRSGAQDIAARACAAVSPQLQDAAPQWLASTARPRHFSTGITPYLAVAATLLVVLGSVLFLVHSIVPAPGTLPPVQAAWVPGRLIPPNHIPGRLRVVVLEAGNYAQSMRVNTPMTLQAKDGPVRLGAESG